VEKKSSAKKPGTAISKPASAKNAAKKAKNARKTALRKAQSRRQQTPEPGRIQEIQQALKDRGYAVEPTGAWGPETVAALRKFQEDNNIENLSGRGKLDSLTLIALGLGPGRETAPPDPPRPPPSQEGKSP
jgi:peptidoglycan hydrolase-like protein with peptidoglycan-binding domain